MLAVHAAKSTSRAGAVRVATAKINRRGLCFLKDTIFCRPVFVVPTGEEAGGNYTPTPWPAYKSRPDSPFVGMTNGGFAFFKPYYSIWPSAAGFRLGRRPGEWMDRTVSGHNVTNSAVSRRIFSWIPDSVFSSDSISATNALRLTSPGFSDCCTYRLAVRL